MLGYFQVAPTHGQVSLVGSVNMGWQPHLAAPSGLSLGRLSAPRRVCWLSLLPLPCSVWTDELQEQAHQEDKEGCLGGLQSSLLTDKATLGGTTGHNQLSSHWVVSLNPCSLTVCHRSTCLTLLSPFLWKVGLTTCSWGSSHDGRPGNHPVMSFWEVSPSLPLAQGWVGLTSK